VSHVIVLTSGYESLPDTIRERIALCKSGCWEWQRCRVPFGYGGVHWNGKFAYAHRVVYELLVGPIPPDRVLDHLCRNPPCCNPGHLEPVTQAVNVARGRATQRLPIVAPETSGGLPWVPRPEGPERWRAVPGYEGRYEVSDFGRIRSLLVNGPGLRGRILRPFRDRRGRLTVTLCRDGRGKSLMIHRLVAEAFIGPRPDGMETRHLNDQAWDNRLVNLAYGTSSENKRDAVRNGRHPESKRTTCDQGHRLAGGNLGYRADGRRFCRECKNASRQRWRQRVLETAEPCATEGCPSFSDRDDGLCRRCRAREKRSGWQTRICPHCGTKFSRSPGPQMGNRKYCSNDCGHRAKLLADRERVRAIRANQ